MEMNQELIQEIEAFLNSKKGVEADAAKADPKGQELKAKCLALFEEMVKADESQLLAGAVAQVKENETEIRAKIGKLVYEGRATEENIKAALESLNTGTDFNASNSCAVCSACSSCAVCGLCGLCFISGVAAASGISVTSVTSTISAINS